MWRCPHCQTPQPESSRCWVCKRSSTSCGTCRHFRRAIAGQFGFCALDRQRRPLIGDEIRGCWQEADRPAATVALMPRETEPIHRLDFVPVGEVHVTAAGPAPTLIVDASVAPPTTAMSSESRSGLWDD
jgi:hypothetical protein